MNPLSINPFGAIGGVLVAVAIGAAGGWAVNGWRLNAEIADMKAARADEISGQYKTALDDFVTSSRVIKSAADRANVDVSALGKKLDTLSKDFKNAKPAPLPPGCLLDDKRLRNLNEAAAAVNETIAGRKPGAAVQNPPSP